MRDGVVTAGLARTDEEESRDGAGGREAGVGAPVSSSSSSSNETISAFGGPKESLRSRIWEGLLLLLVFRSLASGCSMSISLFVHVPSGWIITDSTALFVFCRMSWKYLR